VGSVFISYAHEDRERVEPLVIYLADKGFNIWWDDFIHPGTSFRETIQEVLDEAACVVVIWTDASVKTSNVREEADRGNKHGILVPVCFDTDVDLPYGFGELNYVNLVQWDGTENKELIRMLDRIRLLVKQGPNKWQYRSTLQNSDWFISSSQDAVIKLSYLTSTFRSLGEILLADAKPVKDLRGALHEVWKTYQVVNSAILQFLEPAFQPGDIDVNSYLKMERGSLNDEIRQGRGHCHNILTYYGRFGGLRDLIKGKLSDEKLQEVDDVFARLGTADGDLFYSLVEIGELLTNEARVIVNLLINKENATARQRILEGRNKLAPLESQLNIAMQDLQQLETSLGYTQSSG
jgi:hypothetical protein